MYILKAVIYPNNTVWFKIKSLESLEIDNSNHMPIIEGYNHKIIFGCRITEKDKIKLLLEIIKSQKNIFATFIRGDAKNISNFKAFYTYVEATENLMFYFEIEVPSLKFPAIFLDQIVKDELFIIPPIKNTWSTEELSFTNLIEIANNTLDEIIKERKI